MGETAIVNAPDVGAVTVSDTVAVWVMPPPVPVTVIVYVPTAVLEATTMVSVELPEPGAAMDAGLRLTVTPVGWPGAVKAIVELNPPETLVVIVEVPVLPCTTDTEPGEDVMAKAGEVLVGAKALMSPVPFGLPQPVTRS